MVKLNVTNFNTSEMMLIFEVVNGEIIRSLMKSSLANFKSALREIWFDFCEKIIQFSNFNVFQKKVKLSNSSLTWAKS